MWTVLQPLWWALWVPIKSGKECALFLRNWVITLIICSPPCLFFTLCAALYLYNSHPGLILNCSFFSSVFRLSIYTSFWSVYSTLLYSLQYLQGTFWYTINAEEMIGLSSSFSSFSSFSFSSYCYSFTLLLLFLKQHVQFLSFWLNGFGSLSLHLVYVDLCSQSREILNNLEVNQNQKDFVNYHLLNTHCMTENLLSWLPLKYWNSHSNVIRQFKSFIILQIRTSRSREIAKCNKNYKAQFEAWYLIL